KNQIVVWEVYDCRKGRPIIETVSPNLTADDTPIREKFRLPYPHGELPFPVLRYEAGEEGWYSSRGVPALIGEHEMSLNKMWNSQLQFLDFFGHPVYSNSSMTPINTENFRARPGKILPPGIMPVPAQDAPIEF